MKAAFRCRTPQDIKYLYDDWLAEFGVEALSDWTVRFSTSICLTSTVWKSSSLQPERKINTDKINNIFFIFIYPLPPII
jgi:hypothetical protein